MELEFGAVTKRLEPENLKPLQFEQRLLPLEKQLPGAPFLARPFAREVGLLGPVTHARLRQPCLPDVFTRRIPPPPKTMLEKQQTTSSPQAGEAGHRLKLL
jgi:hypothetical protein